MIDSITFLVSGTSLPEDSQEVSLSWQGLRKGKLAGFHVRETAGGLIVKGSLPKYLMGNNVQPLTRQAVEEALTKLQELSGWDLTASPLLQVEIGYTFTVDKKPSLFFASWGEVPRFKKAVYSGVTVESITYFTKSTSFIAYDKKIEVRTSKQHIPPLFEGFEIIRLELQIKRGLKKQIGRSLSVMDLADRTIYSRLIDLLEGFYFKIPKGRSLLLDTSKVITPSDFEKAIMAYGVQTLGQDYLFKILNDLETRGVFGRTQVSRVKKSIREALEDKRLTVADSLTAELDSKVREVCRLKR